MTTAAPRPRQLLLDCLSSVGYDQNHVELDWPYLNLEALNNQQAGSHTNRVDIAAFDDERRRDLETSAIVCDLQSAGVLTSSERGRERSRMFFEATAAPNVLFGGTDTVDLWLRCQSNAPRRIAGIGFNEQALRRAFRDHRDDLERESLARLRGGQRYLFDRVYDARRDQLAAFLHIGLEQAIRALRRDLATTKKEERQELELALAHVSMALLAARIMEDKEFFGARNQSGNARELLKLAESESNGFFRYVDSSDLSLLDRKLRRGRVDEILQNVMAYLTGPACFSLITPEMLGDLYERALIANGHSGRQSKVDIKGIHYTPLTIAKNILHRIPIEEIPPSQRYIADLACGSGSFLLAASERLRNAFDANESDSEDDVLDHLRSRVIGNDLDEIALLVTRMRYLLHHWVETGSPDDVPTPQLLERNGLEFESTGIDGVQPTVIVGNPPFNPANTAAEFLKAAIRLLAPGGFLGMVMPASFLRGRRDRCPSARLELLNACELLDVWEMPQGTVGIAARHSPCVVIARKTRQPNRTSPVMFKVSHSGQEESVSVFRDDLRSTWTFAATCMSGSRVHWRDDPCHVSQSNQDSLCRVVASPIDSILVKLATHPTLRDVCGTNMVLGIHGRGGGTVVSPTRKEGFEPYLQHQSRIHPFVLAESDWRNDPTSSGAFVNPETAHRAKRPFWSLYRGKKIVLTGRTNRNATVQSAAAFDDHGVFPEDDIRCIALRDGWRTIKVLPPKLADQSDKTVLLWLTAILNSTISQAWIAITSTPRGMTDEVLDTMPIPRTFDSQIVSLIEMISNDPRFAARGGDPVWMMWSDRRANQPGNDYGTIVGQINRLIFRSYGLTHDDFSAVSWFLHGMTNPWVDGEPDAHRPTYTERRIRGTTVSVDVDKQQITLDMPRYSSDPIAVPIPKDFPGWALEEGAEFTCLSPRNDRDPKSVASNRWLLRDFRPLPYAYLSSNALGAMVLQKSAKE